MVAPGWLPERLAASADRSEEISKTALAGEAPICEATMEAFGGNGPLRELLDRVPVHVVLDPAAPLLGAARCAALAGGPA